MSANTAPTFQRGNGKVTTAIGDVSDTAASVVLLTDGRILVAGSTFNGSNSDLGLVRYNANGTLDTTFHGDGKVTTDFAGNEYGAGVALQADGKIVVAGYRNNGSYDFALARYNANGTLDTTFDGDGKILTSLSSGDDLGNSLALQADGKIIVAGRSTITGMSDFALARYNANGSLDATFDGDGKVITSISSTRDEIFGIALQSDGKIVAVGYAQDGQSVALARFNANGALDTTFDGDGKVMTDVGSGFDVGRAVTILPDGRILVAGYSDSGVSLDFMVLRYNANGTLDTTFDGDGKLITVVSTSADEGRALALQSDGKFVVAGYTDGTGGSDFALARYNANGTLDTTFDGDGKLAFDIGGDADQANAVALRADGHIVAAGYSIVGGAAQVAVASFDASGRPDVAFHLVSALDGAPTYVPGGPPVVLDGDVGVFDAELAAQGAYTGATLSLQRHGGANAQDVYSATGLLGSIAQNAAVTYAGAVVGSVTTNAGGRLVLTFNGNATQARVDGVLESIAYSNSNSVTPPASVQIDWIFSDSNTGGQGTGGALAATGSTTVRIFGVYQWTLLADDTLLSPFNPAVDKLRFDSASISAADVRLVSDAISTTFTYLGKDVTLQIPQSALTTTNVVFDNGSRLVVGDNATGGTGDGANNLLAGGSGKDHLIGLAGNDSFDGGPGADRLIGGTGFDYARYKYAPAAVIADLTNPALNTGEAAGDSFNSIEGLVGTSFNDQLRGDLVSNDIAGLDGNDILVGRGGNDNLQGMNGDDTLNGGSEADRMDGGAGFDYARYDDASAGIVASMFNPANNTGDAAGDQYIAIEGLVGSAFKDVLIGDNNANDLQGLDGDDVIEGRGGNDTLGGGNGVDQLNGGLGADALNGGAGADYAIYKYMTSGIVVDLANPAANTGEAAGDTFVSIEGIGGTRFNDMLFGDANGNDLAGNDGDDELTGRAGDDNLQGQNGIDRMNGGPGADKLDGGAGFDVFIFDRGEANGDQLIEFAGNGLLPGDEILFRGYGTALQGATLTQVDATHWSINSSDGVVHDIIEMKNGASIGPTDYVFI